MAERHGYYGTPTYKSWSEMKCRCGNPKRENYKNISYCERWKDFKNFLADMGERPVGTTLDRIDVNGNYEPTNCRWANYHIQATNKNNTRLFEFNGERKTLTDFAQQYGIKRSTLAQRIYCYHWDMGKALNYKKGGDDL